MELGDIINLLLIVGFAVIAPIVGAITKKASKKNTLKKPAATESNSQQDQDIDLMEEFYKNESKKSEKSNLQEEYKNISDQSDTKNEESLDNSENKYTNKENSNIYNQSNLLSNQHQKNFNHKSKKGSNLNRKIIKNFDARKAVIYSEILQKKYF